MIILFFWFLIQQLILHVVVHHLYEMLYPFVLRLLHLFYLPTITTIVNGIHFINMSFEHFFSGQFTLWHISHLVRHFFNGFVLFALLVLLKQYKRPYSNNLISENRRNCMIL